MANKKLFNLELGTPTDSDLIAYGKTGTAYKNITYGDLKNLIVAAVPPIPPTPTFLEKIVNIGAWNMEGTRTKSVSLGVARSKIRGIEVMIISDSGSLQDIAHPHSNEEISGSWKISYTTSSTNAQIDITRVYNFYFSNGNFNNSSMNRGYIIVKYVE